MLVLPGPGLLLIGAGLALLASEFPSVRTQLQRAATIVAAVRARRTGGPDRSFKFRPRAEGRWDGWWALSSKHRLDRSHAWRVARCSVYRDLRRLGIPTRSRCVCGWPMPRGRASTTNALRAWCWP